MRTYREQLAAWKLAVANMERLDAEYTASAKRWDEEYEAVSGGKGGWSELWRSSLAMHRERLATLEALAAAESPR